MYIFIGVRFNNLYCTFVMLCYTLLSTRMFKQKIGANDC